MYGFSPTACAAHFRVTSATQLAYVALCLALKKSKAKWMDVQSNMDIQSVWEERLEDPLPPLP